MHDDFDSAVADRFEVLDEMPVPEFWARAQSKAFNHLSNNYLSNHFSEEEATMIDLESPIETEEQRKRPNRLVLAGLLAAAAVIAIALVAIRNDDPVSPADQPAPTATVPPTAPPPALFAGEEGARAAGTYSIDAIEGAPTGAVTPRIFVTIGDGWSTYGDWGLYKTPEGEDMTFNVPDRVFLNACHPGEGDHPGPLNTVDGLVTALTEQAGWINVTAPTDISIDGYAGKAFQRTTPSDVSDCPVGFTSWTQTVYEPDSTNTVWVVDLDGTVIVLETRVLADQPAEAHAEVAAMLDSIRIAQA